MPRRPAPAAIPPPRRSSRGVSVHKESHYLHKTRQRNKTSRDNAISTLIGPGECAALYEPRSIIGHDRIDKSINSVSRPDARDAQIDTH